MVRLFGLRLIRRIVSLLVLAALVAFGYTAFRVWQVGRQDDRRHTDAILVLGAAQFDGRPSAALEARLSHARALYQAGVAPRVITVGGGQPGDRTTEAAAGQRWLNDHGVPADATLPLPKGRDTLLSLRAAAILFRDRSWRSVTIVTDPWHSLRSRTMARDLRLDAVTAPTHTGPSVRGRLTEARYIFRETVAYLYYRLFHRASPPGPSAT